jgi:hypothetical protein
VEADEPKVKRGLPRPLSRKGMPIPYIAPDGDHLGDKHFGRLGEVLLDQLCQVCGGPVALAVVHREGQVHLERILDGMLHEDCARLAFDYCPALRRWEALALFRVPVGELPLDRDRVPYLPTALQSAEVNPDTLRQQ